MVVVFRCEPRLTGNQGSLAAGGFEQALFWQAVSMAFLAQREDTFISELICLYALLFTSLSMSRRSTLLSRLAHSTFLKRSIRRSLIFAYCADSSSKISRFSSSVLIICESDRST